MPSDIEGWPRSCFLSATISGCTAAVDCLEYFWIAIEHDRSAELPSLLQQFISHSLPGSLTREVLSGLSFVWFPEPSYLRTYTSLCVYLDRIFNARPAHLFLTVTCLSFAVIPLPAPRPLDFFLGVDTGRQTGPKQGRTRGWPAGTVQSA
ncbi:hypothetical protein B9Z19DRAFT_492510 [Tuber borchii]|uniref:Uncharacterized protein n=1 Tax=Tuber borchii TaxID=42251 RepID=A0A2T7A319_TUBBO|nr:hypothetical protein B9Z19DRAFT_492510 [Tuber borchii]